MNLTKFDKTTSFFKTIKSSSAKHIFEKRIRQSKSSFSISKMLKDKTTDSTSKHSINDNSEKSSFNVKDKDKDKDKEEEKGDVSIGDFFFLFGREEEIPEETKLLEETRTNVLINKLGVWDRDNLAYHQDTKDKYHESLIEVEALGISLNKKESVIDAEKLMKDYKVKRANKLTDTIASKSVDKQHFSYQSKGQFDFTVFFANKTQQGTNKTALPSILIEKKQDNAIDKIDLQESQVNYYNQYVRDQKKKELNHKEKLMDLYQKIVVHKLKKKKYEGILDDIYKLLETARIEFSLSIDILKERIIRNEKFYKKSNESLLKNFHNLPDQIHQKIKKQHSYQSASSMGQVVPTGSDADESQISNTNEEKSLHTKTSKVLFNNMIPGTNIQTSQSSSQNKKKHNIMQEKMRIYKEYLSILEDLQNKINQNNVSFNEVKIELTKMINEIKRFIEENNSIMLKLKLMFQTLSKQQKIYYYGLLLQGTDTRSEGLTWIIRKIIELNGALDSSAFPNYLDQEQIDYLIKRSKMEVESNQLKLVLKTLKQRQQEILDQDKFQRLAQLNSFPMHEQESANKVFDCSDLTQRKLLDELNSKFDEILLKHEGILRQSTEQKMEDYQIKSIVMSIKAKLCDYALTNHLYEESNKDNVEKYLDEHKNQKEYYDDIRTIRKRLQLIEDELNKVKREQAEAFRRKFHFIKERQTGKAFSYYENVHNALFGTSSIL